jgi:hypothetical protein
MEEREIGRLGRIVSVIGLGTWQLGADWGSVQAGAVERDFALSVCPDRRPGRMGVDDSADPVEAAVEREMGGSGGIARRPAVAFLELAVEIEDHDVIRSHSL